MASCQSNLGIVSALVCTPFAGGYIMIGLFIIVRFIIARSLHCQTLMPLVQIRPKNLTIYTPVLV